MRQILWKSIRIHRNKLRNTQNYMCDWDPFPKSDHNFICAFKSITLL